MAALASLTYEFHSTTSESTEEDTPEKWKKEDGEADGKETAVQEEADNDSSGLAAAEEDTKKFAKRGVSDTQTH